MPAHMAFLLRESSGAFSVENTYTIAELQALKEEGRLAETLVSMEDTLSFLPALNLPEDVLLKKHLLNGVEISTSRLNFTPIEGLYRVYCGEFIGIGRVENENLRISLMLREAQDAE